MSTRHEAFQEADELQPQEAPRLQVGIIGDDLVLATIEVARELGKEHGIKKYGKTITKALSEDNEDLIAVWQTMADATMPTFDQDWQTAGEVADSAGAALVERIIDTAYELHSGRRVISKEIAGKGLWNVVKRLKVFEQSSTAGAPAPTPTFELPDRLSKLAVVPEIMSSLHAVAATEQSLAEHRQQYTEAVDRHIRSRQNITERTRSIDCQDGLKKIEQALDDKFSPASQIEATVAARHAALDVIAKNLAPEYNETGSMTVPLTDETMPYIVAALGVADGLVAKSGSTTKSIALIDAKMHQLFKENPHRLMLLYAHPDVGLVRLADSGSAITLLRSPEDPNYRRIEFNIAYDIPGKDPADGTEEPAIIVLDTSTRENDIFLIRDYMTAPANDFSKFYDDFIVHRSSTDARLGALFHNRWEDMPVLNEEHRAKVLANYTEEYLRKFLTDIWNYVAMSMPLIQFSAHAVAEGSSHELQNDPGVMAQLAALDTKVWSVKDPLAAQAELRIMGLDGTSFAELIHDVDDIHRYAMSCPAFVGERYRNALSHYVENISGTQIEPPYFLSDHDLAVMERNDAIFGARRAQNRHSRR